MPELRDVKARDAIRAFERAGGQVRIGKGSHVNVKMPNGKLLTFSRMREPVKVGILKAMIRKAGMTESEFLQRLK